MLEAILIDGVTVYPADDLRAYYADRLGSEITVADAFAIAAVIEQRYRQDGYVTSRAIVPQQTIDDGAFRIVIVEGFISDIEFAPDLGPARPMIERLLQPLRDVRPINIADVERRLLLADDLPGMSVRGALNPAPEETGASVLSVTGDRKAIDAAVTVDNRGSWYSGRISTMMLGNLNSFGARGDKITLIGKIGAPASRETLLYGAYSANVGTNGMTWQATSTYAKSRPGFTLTPLDIDSTVVALSASANYPIIRSRRQNLRVEGQLDYRDVDTTLLSDRYTEDRLRIVGVGVNYDRTDSLDGITAYRAVYSQGLGILGASSRGDDLLSRAEGRGTFNKVTAQVTRLQNLPGNFSIMATAVGQMAWQPLLASEEFGFGGANYGRGYDSGELSGDRGVAVLAELRYAPDVTFLPQGVQFYAFYDIGRVWNLDTTATEAEGASSAGFGTRVNVSENFYAFLEAAKPLTRQVDTRSSKNGRVFLGLTARF